MKALITGGKGSIAQAIYKKIDPCVWTYTPGRELLDISKEDQITAYMNHHKPDILINCAGYINPSSIKDTSLEEWNKHININLTGAFLCSKYAILNGCTTIINIISTSALEGRENWGSYCASKAGLMSLTETLAREGINCYAIHPARTETKMRERLFPNEDKTTLMSPDRVADFVIKCLAKEFANGSHIIVKKDRYYVLPMRKVVE